MNSVQYIFQDNQWTPALKLNNKAQWALIFGDRELIEQLAIKNSLKLNFPNAERVGCSTSGEIAGIQLYDKSLILTVIEFEQTEIRCAKVNRNSYSSDGDAVKDLISRLPLSNLKYCMVLSDGQIVNGSHLVEGLRANLPDDVLITGGLAGDDDRFEETKVWHNEESQSGLIVICGLYGDAIKVGYGCLGGWDSFGPVRTVTRSVDNVLYELDGENALQLYKDYLGHHATELPVSALLFPLVISEKEGGDGLVRTILNIDENDQSMTFAGNIPEGNSAQLMRANFDRLIDGASNAANQSTILGQNQSPELALLVSCVGRRLVLGQRIEDELEEVGDVLGDDCTTAGFYSYGEISPVGGGMECKLHNQTMSITTFTEVSCA